MILREKEKNATFLCRLEKKCRFSGVYCIHGYWFDSKQSDRTYGRSDDEKFAALIRGNDTWKIINWFSFFPFGSQSFLKNGLLGIVFRLGPLSK